jgi:DNA-binding transcriptional MerR regulator
LQQILFFRELGFELKQIQKILGRGDFDRMIALSSHRQVLEKDLQRIQGLIKTIDKTMAHLKGTKKMKDRDMYHGFGKGKQADYEQYLINRFGDKVKDSMTECREKLKSWTKGDFEASSREFDEICKDLATLRSKRLKPSSPEVQKVIRRHYEWLKNYWTPQKESYINLGEGYTEFEWKKAFELHDAEHPKLAQFFAEGIKVFATSELS